MNNIDTWSAEQKIASLYVAYLGRAPDIGGFYYWVEQLLEHEDGASDGNAGLSWIQISEWFANSNESYSLNGDITALDHSIIQGFINSVYQRLFDREPDLPGLSYWSEQLLVASTAEVHEFIINILRGAQNSSDGFDIDTLNAVVDTSYSLIELPSISALADAHARFVDEALRKEVAVQVEFNLTADTEADTETPFMQSLDDVLAEALEIFAEALEKSGNATEGARKGLADMVKAHGLLGKIGITAEIIAGIREPDMDLFTVHPHNPDLTVAEFDWYARKAAGLTYGQEPPVVPLPIDDPLYNIAKSLAQMIEVDPLGIPNFLQNVRDIYFDTDRGVLAPLDGSDAEISEPDSGGHADQDNSDPGEADDDNSVEVSVDGSGQSSHGSGNTNSSNTASTGNGGGSATTNDPASTNPDLSSPPDQPDAPTPSDGDTISLPGSNPAPAGHSLSDFIDDFHSTFPNPPTVDSPPVVGPLPTDILSFWAGNGGGSGGTTGAPNGAGEQTGGGERPILIDLNGDGFEIISTPSVSFDINQDGQVELTSWVGPNDGLLVIDLDSNGNISPSGGDGQITIAQEFVFSAWSSDDVTDLEALATAVDSNQNLLFDSDGNGLLDASDNVWNSMAIWRDINSNALSEAGELYFLSDIGITSVGLSYDNSSSFDDASDDVSSGYVSISGVASITIGTTVFTGTVGDATFFYA